MVQRPSSTPVFILAGGAGERLAPLTQTKPKPVVSFGGTHQILDFTLSNCINSGLRKIFVLTQHQREPLHDYVRESRLQLSSSFHAHPGEELRSVPPVSGKRYRGTADAVFQNLSLIRFDDAEHVLIASGDHVYSMDYRPFISRHVASGAEVTIATARRPAKEASSFGVLDVAEGTVTRMREKPSAEALPEDGDVRVSMGIYVFSRRALLNIADSANPMETDFGRDILPRLVRGQKVAAYDFSSLPRNYWRDVGGLDSYFQANMDMLGSGAAFHPEMDSQWPIHTLGDASTLKTRDSRISRRAIIERSTIRRSVVSRGACIEPGALIENSVILPGARVGRNARLRNTILAEGASIPDGFKVGLNPILDRSRFMVTPAGVVVIDAPARRTYERSVHLNVRSQTVTAA